MICLTICHRAFAYNTSNRYYLSFFIMYTTSIAIRRFWINNVVHQCVTVIWFKFCFYKTKSLWRCFIYFWSHQHRYINIEYQYIVYYLTTSMKPDWHSTIWLSRETKNALLQILPVFCLRSIWKTIQRARVPIRANTLNLDKCFCCSHDTSGHKTHR